jgi:hypothetical protein
MLINGLWKDITNFALNHIGALGGQDGPTKYTQQVDWKTISKHKLSHHTSGHFKNIQFEHAE